MAGEAIDDMPRIVDDINAGELPKMLKSSSPTSELGEGIAFTEGFSNRGVVSGGANTAANGVRNFHLADKTHPKTGVPC